MSDSVKIIDGLRSGGGAWNSDSAKIGDQLNLSGRRFKTEEWRAILQALADNRSVTELLMGGQRAPHFIDEVFEEVASTLVANPVLKLIALDSNPRCGDACAEKLADALLQRPAGSAPLTIYLHSTGVGEAGVRVLADAQVAGAPLAKVWVPGETLSTCDAAWAEHVELARGRARGMLTVQVLTVHAGFPGPDGLMSVACTAMSGEEVAQLCVPPGMSLSRFHAELATILQTPVSFLELISADGRVLADMQGAPNLAEALLCNDGRPGTALEDMI